MRNSFTFYKSFYDAIEILGEKAQLKLYKSIMKLNFNCCENVTELEQLCDEIETELKQNRNVFAQFLLMKPHLLKSAKASINGEKGGAPEGNSNAKKTSEKQANIKDKSIKDKDKSIKDKDKDKEETEISKDISKEEKKGYGEFANVFLSEDEYDKLRELYAHHLKDAINRLSSYIEANGKKYKSCYAVLGKHNWVYREILHEIQAKRRY